ncbi:NF045616 family extracytoplasmic (lipo)protein [Acinetobacter calcoaceticus]|uniref:NF045616 family extracytoplasmic (lipo)protein n=1 Tax=Acinetobacter calcoaceticus TaxID=471 RepID=UPI0010637EAA|nr:NF045616 family extracytoplasmic (lipo)protein [Acinetobacter calcoaceticus]
MKLFYLLLFMSNSVSASPGSTLYVKIKDNNFCVFTKGGYDKAYENQTLIYMGKVDGINTFHSSYSKTYLNLKMPVIEENCIKIKPSEFKESLPYDVILETDQSYTQRICVHKTSEGHITLLEAKADLEKGIYCGTNQYDYSSNGLWTKLKNLYYWLINFLN